ncbi:Na(+) H(+) antiporter subunit A [hydrothermal vent metagenome]|uniref:Na(+) H(+) antiporter subunit A n=1 Tax=hydrothermal vent metagenome TaxID=652676 RepID=A0A3B1AKB3_9ZZZZ
MIPINTANEILVLTILLPIIAMAAIILLAKHPNIRDSVSVLASTLLFYLVCSLYSIFNTKQSIESQWFEILPGLELSFKVEPLGTMFALVASFLWFVTTLYSIGYMRAHNERHQTRFYAYFAIAISSVMAIAFSKNLFSLFIFYEILTLSTYPLVTHAGTQKSKLGGRTYLAILLSTSIVFFLFAIILSWFIAGTLEFTNGGIFTDTTSPVLLGVLLVLFIFGVAKAAVMPFHRWLPAAMVAPTPVSALLHAVAVVKAGVFTILKVVIYIFGIDTISVLPTTQTLLYLAGASILLASIVAMRQNNLKARLAYSTVSQLGYVTLGALLATSSSITASSMHITMHAFAKITLFFCAGAILITTHKTDVTQMRGIGRQMPLTMIAFFIASISIIGLPPTGGSWSKWYLLLATIETEQLLLMLVLMISSLLNIAYLLPIPLRAFFPGEKNGQTQTKIIEAPLFSLAAILITTLGCIILFIYPIPLYNLISEIPLRSLAITK